MRSLLQLLVESPVLGGLSRGQHQQEVEAGREDGEDDDCHAKSEETGQVPAVSEDVVLFGESDMKDHDYHG